MLTIEEHHVLEDHFQILGNDTLSSRQQCKEHNFRLAATLIAPFYSHMQTIAHTHTHSNWHQVHLGFWEKNH